MFSSNSWRAIILVLLSSVLFACTEPRETTGVGAATGGVLGAGLGAIVGNQTGDPGSGMAVGAAAGAATGAMIGNALQAQQEAIQTQDEAIERQEQLLAAQRAEIGELRSMQNDSATRPSRLRQDRFDDYYSKRRAGSAQGGISAAKGISAGGAIVEKNIASGPPRAQLPQAADSASDSDDASQPAHGSFGWEQREQRNPSIPATPECKSAEEEYNKSMNVSDRADQLFHLRRALRLCPDVAMFHNRLGELYLTLNREADAEFEFKEALRLDPQYRPAEQNLAKLKQ